MMRMMRGSLSRSPQQRVPRVPRNRVHSLVRRSHAAVSFFSTPEAALKRNSNVVTFPSVGFILDVK